ncbi:AMP-binding protein [Rhizobium sp. L1K21]|uniref:AMP-binding protein n=1 Tax=Rhizobium sp. L1K21 TaxID=2954933 RepID=UPI002093605D|nr:AMP-binding protein [Rhizobium sp. L1K21]MCO6188554.1 AMP-binding protein [Rhizobium sp. L1K21]
MAIRDAVAHWYPETEGFTLIESVVGAALKEQAARAPGALALVYEDETRSIALTYQALDTKTDQLATALLAWGVKKQDRVAVLSPNSPEWVYLEYALAKIGAILVTVNTALKKDEIGYICRQAEVSTLFFVDNVRGYDIASAIEALKPDLPLLERLCCLEGKSRSAISFTELMENSAEHGPDIPHSLTPQPNDIAQIQFTSGTTGAPKGAMLSHRSILNNARMSAARGGFCASDRLLSAMPLFHTAGCVCNVLGMLSCGGTLILMPSFDPQSMIRLMIKHEATIINAVPTMYIRMLEALESWPKKPENWSLRIAYTGGTSIPPSMMRDLKATFDLQPMIIMGMTEASPIITQTRPSDDFETQITTAGTPLPHTEIRIVDPETGDTRKCGEPGELLIRGYQVTKGYYAMPDATAKAIDADGWLHSGDLAVLQKEGYLSIVGRIKDMLIRGGENIYPVEIENFLMGHPAVAEAQVVGVPDPDLGEEIFAFVKCTPGASVNSVELEQYCRANMSRQKLPRYFHFMEHFPLTANGKVQKYELRTIAAEMLKGNAA